MWEAFEPCHMSEGRSTERTAVKTYLPKYQKDEWKAHAEELDMSQSEFVRTMVQAGRRGFEVDPVEPDRSGSDPGGEGLEDRVLDVLSREGPQSWDQLVESLTEDLESRLDATLEDLQSENRVIYSGREGGYTLTEDR